MSYAQNGLIEATDFNTLVGANPETAANKLNTTWAIGGTTAGYGQTAVSQVSAGGTVIATGQWNALVANTASAASHSGSSITSVTAPTSGGTVTYLSAIPTNLTTIYTNRRNAASQGSTITNTTTRATSWQNGITFTHTITFASGDAARYFFNAGGQIKMTASHPTGTGINLLFSDLASDTGTVTMSAPNSGTISIASTNYSGITKIGGGGNAPTVDANKGYFGLTTSNATAFTQLADSGPSGYLSSFIRYIVKSNGTQGSNGDTGSVVTIYSVWDEIPNDLVASASSAVTCTVQLPESTNLSASWGTPTIAGSVSGS
jgi:hypothetical protein|tara:strand:+ start:209 stop:1162 length:954 start_codon:yes stop_codon:yes gene_type:complete